MSDVVFRSSAMEMLARQSDHEPRTYVTEISVPYFGDGGVQRLHGRMKDPGSEPEADLSDAGIEAG